MKKVLSIVFFLMTTLCTFGQVFTDDLHVTSGAGRTTDYTQKEVELKRVAGSGSRYTVTFKKLAPMEYKTFGDFVIDGVMSTVDAETGVTTFATSATEGKWVNVTSTAAIGGVTEGSKSTLTSFTATLSADKSKFVAELNFMTMGSDVSVVFGKQIDTAINTLTTADDNTYVEIYNLGGVRIQHLQRGINIVRTANGKVNLNSATL